MVFHNHNVSTTVLCYIMTGLRRVCSVDTNSKSATKEKEEKQKQNIKLEDKHSCWQKFRPVQTSEEKTLGKICHKTTRRSGGLNSEIKGSAVGQVKCQSGVRDQNASGGRQLSKSSAVILWPFPSYF